jgi:hypothetical protein
MIEKETIQELFDDIKEVEKWNTNHPLLYSYFFLDKSLEKLEIARKELEKVGYEFVEVFTAEPQEDDESKMYYLQVEKVEIHSVNSLFDRNKELYSVAEKFKLDSYDGFDIGKVE